MVIVVMALGSILGAGNTLFLPVGKFIGLQALLIPPGPWSEHQVHYTPKTSGHAVGSSVT
jgi:hypothetical protein